LSRENRIARLAKGERKRYLGGRAAPHTFSFKGLAAALYALPDS